MSEPQFLIVTDFPAKFCEIFAKETDAVYGEIFVGVKIPSRKFVPICHSALQRLKKTLMERHGFFRRLPPIVTNPIVATHPYVDWYIPKPLMEVRADTVVDDIAGHDERFWMTDSVIDQLLDRIIGHPADIVIETNVNCVFIDTVFEKQANGGIFVGGAFWDWNQLEKRVLTGQFIQVFNVFFVCCIHPEVVFGNDVLVLEQIRTQYFQIFLPASRGDRNNFHEVI